MKRQAPVSDIQAKIEREMLALVAAIYHAMSTTEDEGVPVMVRAAIGLFDITAEVRIKPISRGELAQ